LLAVGVGLLLARAELFTDAAIDTARALRISTLAMGLLLAGAEVDGDGGPLSQFRRDGA
jgi:hypothetical protein